MAHVLGPTYNFSIYRKPMVITDYEEVYSQEKCRSEKPFI